MERHLREGEDTYASATSSSQSQMDYPARPVGRDPKSGSGAVLKDSTSLLESNNQVLLPQILSTHGVMIHCYYSAL